MSGIKYVSMPLARVAIQENLENIATVAIQEDRNGVLSHNLSMPGIKELTGKMKSAYNAVHFVPINSIAFIYNDIRGNIGLFFSLQNLTKPDIENKFQTGNGNKNFNRPIANSGTYNTKKNQNKNLIMKP